MPFNSIYKFNEFNEFHQAAKGQVRSQHADIHVFRLQEIGNAVVDKMPLFRTNFYQIGLMRRANFKMSIYENEYELNQKCAIVLFKPGQLIQFQSDPNWEGYVVMFKETLIHINQDNPQARKEFSLLDPTTESFTFISQESFTELSEIYEKLLYEYAQEILRSMPIIELYLHILFHKIEALCKPSLLDINDHKFSSRKAIITYQFKKLIQQNLRTTKNVSDYADMLHISPKYLIEAVSEIAGQSPKEIINQQLITEAKTLLRFSEYPIYDIAVAYNFNDQAHFANFFRQKTQLSPLEYRKSANNTPETELFTNTTE
ncbi:MAG: AraC family transcriptional regulator [Microscillaceae bacterium]|jgi:AraC-like DNA-binding protein|nr:AraC family transcriptional regulator [Microscillaceae bacterium]